MSILVDQAWGQGIPPHLFDALIHFTSQFDIHVCVLHLASVSTLGLFMTAAPGGISGPALASMQIASTGPDLHACLRICACLVA